MSSSEETTKWSDEDIGDFSVTRAFVQNHLGNGNVRFEDEEHYPKAFDRSQLDRKALRHRKLQCTTLGDCVAVPHVSKFVSMDMVPEVEGINWLTPNDNDDGLLELLSLVNRTREGTGLLMIVSVLDRTEYEMLQYDEELPTIGYVLANASQALVIKPENFAAAEAMASLLRSTEICKVVLNPALDLLTLLTNFPTNPNLVFGMSNAVETMMQRIQLKVPDAGTNPMVQFNKMTGLQMPVVSTEDIKTPEMLEFLERMFENLKFLVTFANHDDNFDDVICFGMNWKKEVVLQPLLNFMPDALGDENFWIQICRYDCSQGGFPFLVASLLYCTHPTLAVLDVNEQVYQRKDMIATVYQQLRTAGEASKEPLKVLVHDPPEVSIKKDLINWLMYERSTVRVANRNPLVRDALTLMLFYVPALCDFIDCRCKH